jgi:acyl-CoA synthetase (AMP-forming)/AMP-acid ligase II
VQIGDLVHRAAQRFGDAPAITCDGRTLSFSDFDAATDKLGNALLDGGLRAGDRVGVLMPNGIDGLLAYYALAKAGLVRVSLNVRDTPADHEFRVRDAECRALIADRPGSASTEFTFSQDDLARMLADGRDDRCDVARDPEEPYRLGYTGGTTGPPKAVTLSSRSEHSEIANYLLDLVPDIGQGDVMLHAAPVTHASGSFFLPHLIRGAHNVVLPSFDAGGYLEELERCQPTATFLVPTMLAMLLDHPGVEQVSASRLRHLCYGASPIAPSVAERAQQIFGRVLAQTYGQSEAPMTISLLRPDEHDRVGSAGRPYTLVEVRIFDEDDREVPRGASGEVVVRGQILMSGYWNRPEETARAMRGGWLHTGDVGRLDDEGFLYLLDRRNDVIISGGFNVYPREVEDVLLDHPQVREAAVIGVADERWGEVVQAVVSLRAPVAEEELLAWVRPRLAGYKRPRAVHFSEDLPKSSAGKILRRAVRDERAAAAVNGGHGPVVDPAGRN